MKISQGTKMIYHVIKSSVSMKRDSELSNSIIDFGSTTEWFLGGVICNK
jgi:hypothetical protein